jgi:transcription elongation factor Elf1
MYKVNIEKCGAQEIELYELFSDLFHKYENGISVKNDEEADETIQKCYDMYNGYGGE